MNLPTIDEVMAATGISRSAAKTRRLKYRDGLIDKTKLYAPARKDDTKERIQKVMRRTGLSWDGAKHRLDAYDRGRLSGWRLFEPPHESLSVAAKKRGRPASTVKRAVTVAVARRLTEAERLALIPGATQWERENLGEI